MSNVSGPFEIHTNITLGGGKRIFRDKTINVKTSAVIDVSDAYSGGAKAEYHDGALVRNLCYVDDAATVSVKDGLTATGENGGVVFNYVGNGNKSTIRLPPSALLGATLTRFFISAWFKIKPGANNPANNNYNFIYIGSGPGNDATPSAAFRWGDTRAKGTEIKNVPTTFIIYGKVLPLPASVTDVLASVAQNQVFNIAFDVVFDETGANKNTFYVDIYINGSLVGSAGPLTAESREDATAAYVLCAPETSSPLAGVVFYRFRADDLSESAMTGGDVAAAEYNGNRGYFR